MFECEICGHGVKQVGYEYICTVCGCKAGDVGTVEAASKQSAADSREFWSFMVYLWINAYDRGYGPSAEAKRLYQYAKDKAEHYSQLAEGHEPSEETKQFIKMLMEMNE